MFECLNLRNVLVVALLIRVGALIAMHDGLSLDTDAYQLTLTDTDTYPPILILTH